MISLDYFIKSHKYSRKEFKNGTWYYYYDKHNNFGRIAQCKSNVLSFFINKKLPEEKQCEQVAKQATDYINNVWLKDWRENPDKAICKELQNKKIVFEDISYKHISEQGSNSKGGKQNRSLRNMLDHVRYLPCAKELLESIGVWTHARYKMLEKPYIDNTGKKVIGHVYQSIIGKAPAEDKINNYVQVIVSKVKYSDNTYGNTVYISTMGRTGIKKARDINSCIDVRKSGVKEVHSFDSTGIWQSHADENIPNPFSDVNDLYLDRKARYERRKEAYLEKLGRGYIAYLKKYYPELL